MVAVLLLLSAHGTSEAATTIFLLAALSDLLDGQLARRTRNVTELGRKLDPVADRVLVGLTVIALAVAGVLPAWGVILLVARDISLMFAYGFFHRRGVNLRVSVLGKAYTAVMMMAVVAAMAGIEPGGVRLGWWLFWLAVAGSLSSGVFYALGGLLRLSRVRGRAAYRG